MMSDNVSEMAGAGAHAAMPRDVVVIGGTGYMGRRLIPALIGRGHRVRALARKTSLGRVGKGAVPVVGNALEESSVAAALAPGDTIVHLIGTPHPNPSKAEEFRRVDFPSIQASVGAATRAGVAHLIYVSVAQPAPVMREFIAVRAAGERLISEAKLTATVLRPWYVLGPGHWWPAALLPLYGLASLIPVLRDGARRLGLVTIGQMTRALVQAVEQPPGKGSVRIIDVPTIRSASLIGASRGD